ncbi:hypothetical protein WJX84_002107 [Apatococcus fuscideae]|uniref:MSP domain-containing protein n=1 Tax=Apatococcus fuscideae TaxID=2026836 RepID=A0AAW1S188_9CHLO
MRGSTVQGQPDATSKPAGIPVAGAQLELDCQVDSRFESRESRTTTTAGKICKQPRLGPVGWVFQRYADGSFVALPYGLDSTVEQRHKPILAEEPIMKLDHAMLLMEDFDVVPQLLPRRDIRTAFKLAADTEQPAAAVTSIKASIPPGQPKRLHFSQFCDFLVRIAMAVSAKRPHPPPTLRGNEVIPEEEVRKFLKELGLCGPQASGLQEHVHQIFREGNELRGHKKALLQWEYHFCKSGMDAAAKRAGRAGSWNPCSPNSAPPALLKRVLHKDLGFQLAEAPAWRTLPTPALDVGSVHQGTRLGYRLLLRNRGNQQLKVTAHAKACPCVTLAYTKNPVCSGIPFVIGVKVSTDRPGQHQGVLEILMASIKRVAEKASRHAGFTPSAADHGDVFFLGTSALFCCS